jgi:hypothetical protein
MLSGQSQQAQVTSQQQTAESIMLQSLTQPSIAITLPVTMSERNEAISSIATAKEKLKNKYFDLYNKIYKSTQISEIKQNILNAKFVEESNTPSACGYVAKPCLTGTFVGGALGSGTGVFAVIGAAVLVALPFCCCGICLCCLARHDSSNTPNSSNNGADYKFSNIHSNDSAKDANYKFLDANSGQGDDQGANDWQVMCDKLGGFVKSAAGLVCNPKVALWGSVAGASIGGITGAACGYCSYQNATVEMQIRLDLLKELYLSYSIAERFTQSEDGLKPMVSPTMSRGDDAKGMDQVISSAALEKKPLLNQTANVNTSLSFFPPLVENVTATSQTHNEQKKELSKSSTVAHPSL